MSMPIEAKGAVVVSMSCFSRCCGVVLADYPRGGSSRSIPLADSLGSEYIDRGKARPACQAIPEIDRKTHITGPK
jgi:hypothetical protein